ALTYTLVASSKCAYIPPYLAEIVERLFDDRFSSHFHSTESSQFNSTTAVQGAYLAEIERLLSAVFPRTFILPRASQLNITAAVQGPAGGSSRGGGFRQHVHGPRTSRYQALYVK
ncbi:unnamed protein product, partial [Ectocarpus sp. 8 AP-2014]